MIRCRFENSDIAGGQNEQSRGGAAMTTASKPFHDWRLIDRDTEAVAVEERSSRQMRVNRSHAARLASLNRDLSLFFRSIQPFVHIDIRAPEREGIGSASEFLFLLYPGLSISACPAAVRSMTLPKAIGYPSRFLSRHRYRGGRWPSPSSGHRFTKILARNQSSKRPTMSLLW